MFRVEDTILSDDIATTRFACDLPKCKGACCVVGDAGAPVADDERSQLEQAFELLKHELHPEARKTVEKQGVVQQSKHGLELSCRENEECIFVTYEDDIAYCAIQKAFLEGRIEWEKPISCHLYPIRLKRVGEIEYANFEYINKLCSAACVKGEKEDVYLSDLLEKPLVRRYGKDWYDEFEEKCKEMRIKSDEAAVL
jgi:Fe-S-cluster containining protein